MAVGPFLSNGGLEEPRQSRIERWTLVLDIGRLKHSARGVSGDRWVRRLLFALRFVRMLTIQ